MSRARKFLALPASDRRLLAEAALLVGAARLGLWLLPFRALPGLLAKVAGRPSPPRPLSQSRERGSKVFPSPWQRGSKVFPSPWQWERGRRRSGGGEGLPAE